MHISSELVHWGVPLKRAVSEHCEDLACEREGPIVDVKEALARREALRSELVRLFQLVMASESDSFLRQVGARIPSEEERGKARREVALLGGKHRAWDRIKEVQGEQERIGQELRTQLQRVGLKAILPLLEAESYEQLLDAAGRMQIYRLTPEWREVGALPVGSEPDVKAVVREFGGGKYQIAHPAVGDSEERREVLEFGGPSKDRDLTEVLAAWGLRIREGD